MIIDYSDINRVSLANHNLLLCFVIPVIFLGCIWSNHLLESLLTAILW